ncbi:hypothetical protein KR093_008343, partial [Drosophila rubida]
VNDSVQAWNWLLLAICMTTTLGSTVPVGYFFGVLNAPAEIIKSWCDNILFSEYDTNSSWSQIDLLWTFIVSIYLIGGIIGGIIGSLCAAGLNTKFGRLGVLRITDVFYAVCFILTALCRFKVDSVEMLAVARLFGGMAAAIVYATHPMYLVEIAPPELSGSVGVFTGIGLTFGIVVGQLFSFDFLLGTEEHWHWALSAFIIFVMLGTIVTCIIPESPRFLVGRGRLEAAKTALKNLRGSDQNVDKELAAMVADAGATDSTLGMKDVICNGKLRLVIILVVSFHFVQQGSGISAIWYYSVGTFTDAGFSTSIALWLNFALGVLNFLGAFAGVIFMDKCNRRTLLIISCILSSFFMLLLSFALYLTDNYQWVSYISIAFLALYIIAFNVALGTMPYFIGSELLVISSRAAVMALGSLSNWVSNFVISLVFPILSDIIGPFAFLLFAIICVYGFLVTYRYLPETKNRKPEEVAPLMENGLKSKVK